METKNAETVKVLEKALTILEMIKNSDHPLGVNEISRDCGINLTTAFRILKTLKIRGWIYQVSNDKYIIGPRISYVTEKNNFYMALKEIAFFSMSRLSAMASQAMNLIVRENDHCFILQQSRTEKIVDYVPPIGTRLPIYASAGGKVLLSELPDSLLEEILNRIDYKPLTKFTITKRTALMETLIKCREAGFATDVHESQEEGTCIAVPVRGPDRAIIAALSFSGIIGSLNGNEIDFYVRHLKKASDDISRQLFQYQNEA